MINNKKESQLKDDVGFLWWQQWDLRWPTRGVLMLQNNDRFSLQLQDIISGESYKKIDRTCLNLIVNQHNHETQSNTDASGAAHVIYSKDNCLGTIRT